MKRRSRLLTLQGLAHRHNRYPHVAQGTDSLLAYGDRVREIEGRPNVQVTTDDSSIVISGDAPSALAEPWIAEQNTLRAYYGEEIDLDLLDTTNLFHVAQRFSLLCSSCLIACCTGVLTLFSSIQIDFDC